MEICIYLYTLQKLYQFAHVHSSPPCIPYAQMDPPSPTETTEDSILECVNTAKPPRVRHPYATPSSKSSLQGTLTSTYMGSFPPSHLSVGPGRKL